MASVWADRVAALLIEASALTLELYEAIAEGVADTLRAQRGEDVW